MERGPPHPKLMSILKHFLPPFVLRPYRNLQQRLDRVELSVRCLEWALDAMIVSPKYTPADDIGFNGQAHRKRMFSEIISAGQQHGLHGANGAPPGYIVRTQSALPRAG
jgi:hypothetical protein